MYYTVVKDITFVQWRQRFCTWIKSASCVRMLRVKRQLCTVIIQMIFANGPDNWLYIAQTDHIGHFGNVLMIFRVTFYFFLRQPRKVEKKKFLYTIFPEKIQKYWILYRVQTRCPILTVTPSSIRRDFVCTPKTLDFPEGNTDLPDQFQAHSLPRNSGMLGKALTTYEVKIGFTSENPVRHQFIESASWESRFLGKKETSSSCCQVHQ